MSKGRFLNSGPIAIFLMMAIFFGWIAYFHTVYLDGLEILPRDNGKYHYPIFLYVVRHLELLGHFPQWMYSNEGGIWIETLANNFLLLMPHHWLAYAVAYFGGAEPLVIYKVSLLVGTAIFLWGIYLLVKELGWKTELRCLFLLAVFFSGTVLSFSHQEHLLGTMFWLPFLWLCLLRARYQSYQLCLFAILLGLSFNNHYPQLIMIYWLAILLASVASFSSYRQALAQLVSSAKRGGLRLGLLSLVGFLVSASPVLYSYFSFKDRLESPFRHQKGGIASVNYEEYELINSAYSKADPRNFFLFFDFENGQRWNVSLLDDVLFYASPCLLFLLFVLLSRKIPKRGFHLTLLLLFAFLAVGTYTTLPKYLMWIIPGIKLFRQWYFFVAFLGLHALFALFCSIDFILNEATGKYSRAIWLLGFFGMMPTLLWLPPLYVVPGILACFLFAYFEMPYRKRLIGSLLWGWLVLGSMSTGRFIMGTYSENLIPLESSPLYASSSRISINDPLTELKNIYTNFVALPSGMTPGARKAAGLANYYWNQSPGQISTISHQKWFISFPTGTKNFRWMQFNDGNWDFETFPHGEKKLASSSELFPSIQLTGGESGIRVTRRASLWNHLIWLMWLPLGVFLMRQRTSPKLFAARNAASCLQSLDAL